MTNPPTQYATDSNLRARQRLWQQQDPFFDIVGWVLGLVRVEIGSRVLDIGCGNGAYLGRLSEAGITPVGCDLSPGMLAAAAARDEARLLVCGDAERIPCCTDSFDVVLAPHMLYHVDDRASAAREMRRVLRPGGRCVVVTNGVGHMRALRDLVEKAVREATPGWEMRNPSTHDFSLENGAEQLRGCFASIETMRPAQFGPVKIRDAGIVGDYVASVGDLYQPGSGRPWSEVVRDVRRAVDATIMTEGAFTVSGEFGAFVCR